MRRLRLLVFPVLFALCWQSLEANNYLHVFDASSSGGAASEVSNWEAVNQGMMAVAQGLGQAREALLAGSSAAVLNDALAGPAADLDAAVEALRTVQDGHLKLPLRAA